MQVQILSAHPASKSKLRNEDTMNKFTLIPTSDIAGAAELEQAFDAVTSALALVNEAETIAKQEKSSLCEGPEFIHVPPIPDSTPNWKRRDAEQARQRKVDEKVAERDRRRLIYFGCKLRVVVHMEALSKAHRQLQLAVGKIRECVDTLPPHLQSECAMFNCFSADTLLFEVQLRLRQLRRCHDWNYGLINGGGDADGDQLEVWPQHEYLTPGNPVNLHELLQRQYGANAREYFCTFGAWSHPEAGEVPPPPYLTRAEAEDEVGAWESYADTIGGTGAVHNARELKALAEKK